MMTLEGFEEQIDSWRNPKRKLKNRKNYIKLQIQRQMLVWIGSGQVAEVTDVYKKYKVDYNLDIDWRNSKGESVLSQAELYDNSIQDGRLGFSCYQKIQELMGPQPNSSSDKVKEVIRSHDDKELAFLLSHYTKARLPYDVLWEVLHVGTPDQLQEILNKFPSIIAKAAESSERSGAVVGSIHKPTWSAAEKFSACLKDVYFGEGKTDTLELIFLALKLKLWNFAASVHASPSHLPTEDIIQTLAETDFLKNSWADHLLMLLYRTKVLPKHSDAHSSSKPSRHTPEMCCPALLAALDKHNVPMLELVMAYGGISFDESPVWSAVAPCPSPCQVRNWWWWAFDYETQKDTAKDLALILLAYGAIPDLCYDDACCHILVKIMYSGIKSKENAELLRVLIGGVWDVNNIKSVIYPYEQINTDNINSVSNSVSALQKQLTELSLDNAEDKTPKKNDHLRNTPTRRSARHNSKPMREENQGPIQSLSEQNSNMNPGDEPFGRTYSRKSSRQNKRTTKVSKTSSKLSNDKENVAVVETSDITMDTENQDHQQTLCSPQEVPSIRISSDLLGSIPQGGRLTPHPTRVLPDKPPSEAQSQLHDKPPVDAQSLVQDKPPSDAQSLVQDKPSGDAQNLVQDKPSGDAQNLLTDKSPRDAHSLLDCAVAMRADTQLIQLLLDAGCLPSSDTDNKDIQDALIEAGPRSLLHLCRSTVRNQISKSSSRSKSLHQVVGMLPLALKMKDFLLFMK